MQYLRRRGLIHLSLFSISGGNSRRIADFVVRQVQDWELLPAQPVGSWLAEDMRALHQRPAPHPLQPPQQPALLHAGLRSGP
jgi:hypothetical protein